MVLVFSYPLKIKFELYGLRELFCLLPLALTWLR